MDSGEIRALIKLLDDENNDIVATVKVRLLEKGIVSLPFLEEANADASPLLRERIRSITEEVASVEVRVQFERLVRHDASGIDLEAGALLIARYGYPTENMNRCSEALDGFANELDSKLDSHDDPLDIISKVLSFLSLEKGFKGNTDDYYDPENSYLNRVLDRRTGLPISLCTIYLLVAKRLNIPLSGVGMPGHFMLKYQVGEKEIFLDPFRGPKLLLRSDCRDFIETTGYGFREEYLSAISSRQVLERMIRNLIVAYRQKGQMQRVPGLQNLLGVLGTS
jgi:regulator of sirC expression with transglutaminase-like and TPR domain